MARKLRLEEDGGIYHVINRGNYRQWIFHEEGTKEAFGKALGECCERFKWVLHAYCLMGNHFHLAVETPQGNLSEGMRWLQATFANRFNRVRKEQGRLFQGRFKSLTVENPERLGWLCHYIHLNPVRAGICPVAELGEYRWSSYWYLSRAKERPIFLSFEACLAGAGELNDSRAGWNHYGKYLAWLSEDEPARKRMEFERMSRGWAIGTKGFHKTIVGDEKELRTRFKLNQAEIREARELRWEAGLEQALEQLGKTAAQIAEDRKAAPWKVAIAALLKGHFTCTNGWIAERLTMGTGTGVSRYVAELNAGQRPEAAKLFARLKAKVK